MTFASGIPTLPKTFCEIVLRLLHIHRGWQHL